MEEHYPGARGEDGGDEPDDPVGETQTKKCDQRHARDGEDERDDSKRGQAAAEMRDRPGEDEVERCAAALAEDRVQDVPERAAADEERECLVLVRRPGAQEPAQDAGERG